MARREWEDFPQRLTEVLLEFHMKKQVVLGPMAKADAYGMRTHFYRFRDAVNRRLRETSKLEGGKIAGEGEREHLGILSVAFSTLIIRMKEEINPEVKDSWTLTLATNPLETVQMRSPDDAADAADAA